VSTTNKDLLVEARELLDKVWQEPLAPAESYLANATMDLLIYLEGMEAVTNSQPTAQETAPSVECPTCKAANNPDNRNCAHCRASLFGVTQETTTDAPACEHMTKMALKAGWAWCIRCGSLYDGTEWILPHLVKEPTPAGSA